MYMSDNPKKIVIVSSAPQIRYPDCYGIDMAKLGDFIAFKAAIELLKDRGLESTIQEVYQKCKAQVDLANEEVVNYVKEIYKPFVATETRHTNNINFCLKIFFQIIYPLRYKNCFFIRCY